MSFGILRRYRSYVFRGFAISLPTLFALMLLGQSQTIVTANGSAYPPVRDMHLLTAATGWALAGERILWTGNAGLSWTDVGPILTGGKVIDLVDFLDRRRGWAIVHEGSGTELPPISVAFTTDGGQTWSLATLPASTFLLQEYANKAHMSFSDEAHGWALTDIASSSAASRGNLFATSDGGKTWSALPDPPINGDIQFFSDGTGYLSGGVHQDELYRTRDGGHSWISIVISLPAPIHPYTTASGYVTHANYVGMSFQTPEQGTVALLVHETETTDSLLTYATSDSGETWQPRKLESNLHGLGPLALFDSSYIEVRREGGRIAFRQGSQRSIPLLPAAIMKRLAADKADFVDAQHGWVLLAGGSLLGTRNGGQTASVLLYSGSTQRQQRSAARQQRAATRFANFSIVAMISDCRVESGAPLTKRFTKSTILARIGKP